MEAAIIGAVVLCIFLHVSTVKTTDEFHGLSNILFQSTVSSLCTEVIEPFGYHCSEHTIQTDDGYILGLQRVSSHSGSLRAKKGPPVLLLHGLFMAGDAWFMDSNNQSLGYILADQGFDVWVGNVRGTRWSHGHVSLSVRDKEFWNWSWEELALFDFSGMIRHVYSVTNSRVFVVGHSQGTVVPLAAFTQSDTPKMVEAAALLCPISYLEHVSAPLVLRMVWMHLDQMILGLGIHELNFKNDVLRLLLSDMCDGHLDCDNMLASITGPNCCVNTSRLNGYLEYEPHPSSTKNLNHYFQMIRKGSFSKYDYGRWKNLKIYGQLTPPKFDLSRIPKSLPIWIGVGGNDALSDVVDVQRAVKELKSKPDMLYIQHYGHLDFLLSVKAKEDVYDNMIEFFKSHIR